MATVGTDAKARAIEEITAWCEDKGTIVFLPHLLKLLDTEYLRTWTGLHDAIWPYEPAPVETKKASAVGKRQSPIQPSFSCISDSLEGSASLHQIPSPSSPLWKTRVISSSTVCPAYSSLTAASLVNLRVQQSPGGTGQIHARLSLRRHKQVALQCAVVQLQSPPQFSMRQSPDRCVVHSEAMENTVSGISTPGGLHADQAPLGETIETAVFSSDNDSNWDDESGKSVSSGSDADSDCETYVEEVIQEDLPRMGLLKWDARNEKNLSSYSFLM
ncbi:hypothetical protein R1sor_027498 [Riccia sorocarpa]|uniref:Uncharacterized protein n=1 Tax=Riccia sorocarpa TaxID=122646 RepID=A0ABD3GED3_9MARC